MGIARIAAFARQLGPEQRRPELMLVLDGIVARTNRLRGFIRDGIEDKAAQARLLADEVADNDRAIAALPADAPADRHQALEQARRRNAAALQDKRETPACSATA